MLRTYQFDHPTTNESRLLDGWSYLWASLFGPFYVVVRGFPVHALAMIPISAAIAVTAFVGFGFVDWILGSQLITMIALFATPILALAAQGVAAIEIVRVGYRRRGWREGY
jgi:hypothetical protein